MRTQAPKKYIYIASFVFVVALSFFLLQYILKSNISDTSEYKVPNIRIQKSDIGGRGVFANQNYSVGDIIEICPTIKQKEKEVVGHINDYVFSFDSEYNLIGFGYCSMYNHKDNPNANWEVLNENQIQIKVAKPIHKGEEIFVSYGEEYFNQRAHLIQNK